MILRRIAFATLLGAAVMMPGVVSADCGHPHGGYAQYGGGYAGAYGGGYGAAYGNAGWGCCRPAPVCRPACPPPCCDPCEQRCGLFGLGIFGIL